MNITINEKGQGFVEYALILIIVAIGALIVLALFGEQINDLYIFIRDELIATIQ